MKNDKIYKIIAVVAIIIGIAGVTIGYAAFSNNLTINSAAEVTPSSANFKVVFSSSDESVSTSAVVPTLSDENVTGFSATSGTIDNSGDPTLTNLKATFTEPGQSVTYTFYAYNTGQYIAYLKSIEFIGSKTCTPRTGTTQSLVTSACTSITLSVQVGSENATSTTVSNISGHSLAKNTPETVVVTIDYDSAGAIADGIFDVAFPSIVLTYSSAN